MDEDPHSHLPLHRLAGGVHCYDPSKDIVMPSFKELSTFLPSGEPTTFRNLPQAATAFLKQFRNLQQAATAFLQNSATAFLSHSQPS